MKLRGKGSNPPGCFYYLVRETGTRIPQFGNTTLYGCYEAVKEHLHANGYDIPSSLLSQIEEFCCKQKTSLGWCREERGKSPLPLPGGDFSMALSRISQGTKSLASWMTEGREDEAVAERRAAICTYCIENRPIQESTCKGCGAAAFNRFIQLVTGVLKGFAPQPWEKDLKACRICGCNLRLKIRTKLAPIRRYMRDDQLKALPAGCWIKTEKCE